VNLISRVYFSVGVVIYFPIFGLNLGPLCYNGRVLDSEIKILKLVLASLSDAKQHIEGILPSNWNGEFNKKAALGDVKYAIRTLKSLMERKS